MKYGAPKLKYEDPWLIIELRGHGVLSHLASILSTALTKTMNEMPENKTQFMNEYDKKKRHDWIDK